MPASKIKIVAGCVLLLVPAAVTGLIAAFLLTPALWKLEGVLGIKLAGHSGPADGVIIFTMGVFWGLFVLIYLSRRR
jgi:hypothetical protein